MPWNDPGPNGKKNDPWGKKDQGPPDLDKFFSDLVKKLRGFFLKNNNNGSSKQPTTAQSSGFLLGIIAFILIVLWFMSGLFIVNPAEEAVVLRFGQFSQVLQPGLHWIARFIDTKYLVDVQKIYSFSLEGDFLTKSADQSDLNNSSLSADVLKQTGIADQSKNLVNVELNVQYRVSDPRAYLFNVIDPDNTINEVAAGALSDRVGQMKLDEVLTTGRETLSSGVLERIKKVLVPYQTGLEVIAVTLRKVQAPDQVRVAFNDVNRADQDKATYIQQAEAYASKVVPLAQGLAARINADANAYQQQVVLTAEANTVRYQALLNAYIQSPLVTEERMYFDTMQAVLQHTSKVLLDAHSNNLIYLPIDKLLANQTANDENSLADNSDRTFPKLILGNSDLTSSNNNPAVSTEVKNDAN